MNEEPNLSRPQSGNDNASDPQRGLVADFVMALRFYSLIPVPNMPHETPDLTRIARAAPFAGLVIGALPVLLMLLGGGLHLPPLYTAILVIGVASVLTGAMAEDAIGDAADGLLGGRTPERRLEIFKDSTLGAYGVVAIIFSLGLRVAAIGGMLAVNPLAGAGAWLGASLLARSGSLWLPHALSSARNAGASASAGPLDRQTFLIGIGFATLLAFIFAVPVVGVFGLVLALVAAGLVIWGWTGFCTKLVGGQTGDLIGALQALIEVSVLSIFLIIVMH